MQSPTNNGDLAVPPGDLQFIEKVGSGGYGEVWKGKWRGKGGGIIVAIKKVAVNKMNPRQQREILLEVGIHFIHVFDVIVVPFLFMFVCYLSDLTFVWLTTNDYIWLQSYILTKFRHPNILWIFGACFFEERELWIVMEFMDGGSLYEWLHSDWHIGWDVRLRYDKIHHIHHHFAHRWVHSKNRSDKKERTTHSD